MKFKDAIEQDVKKVFINPNEFAEVHEINGVSLFCVVDKDVVAEAQQRFEGIFTNTVTIYISERDLEVKPVEGELMSVDEEQYIVRSVSVETGVYVIVAEVNAQ